MNSLKRYEELAVETRCTIIDIAASDVGCHIGGSLSVCDILLYSLDRFLPNENNCVVLSKGHAAAALYSALFKLGYLDEDPSESYGKEGSLFTGHPSHLIPNVKFATGSLGHGVGYATGWALAHQQPHNYGKAVVICGDGELQEGLCWEVLQIVSAYRLSNFIIVIDLNGGQNDGLVDDISPMYSLPDRIRSYGFDVVEIDGHHFAEIEKAYDQHTGIRPMAIIAHTMKGKGVTTLEGNAASHYACIKRFQAINWKREVKNALC